MLELDAAIPKDWTVVSGGAHFAGIAMTHFYGRRAENVHVINDFGAIGSAFPTAIGVAAARGDGKVLLIEGDGSLSPKGRDKVLAAVRAWGVEGRWRLALPVNRLDVVIDGVGEDPRHIALRSADPGYARYLEAAS